MREPPKLRNGAHFPIAIILAGGLGTRLRAVHPAVPKPMVPVCGYPFIHYIAAYLAAAGVKEIVVSTGYKGDQIEAHFAAARLRSSVRCVQEPEPLGTGGAIAFTLSRIDVRDWFFVLNGDSIVALDLPAMIERARDGTEGVLTAVRVPDARRFGTLEINAQGFLTGFREKTHDESARAINAGVYLLNRSLFPSSDGRHPCSLESEILPLWLERGKRLAVVQSPGPFIDIGTPESLAVADHFVKRCGLFAAQV